MQALKWLKQHNPLYGDITITKISEDIFNHKEEKVTDGENVNEDISELTCLPSGEDILYIQQPDSIGSKPNDSVPDTIYHTCRYSNVMQALKWLKQHKPLYGDITITKMSEDMFNHMEKKSLTVKM